MDPHSSAFEREEEEYEYTQLPTNQQEPNSYLFERRIWALFEENPDFDVYCVHLAHYLVRKANSLRWRLRFGLPTDYTFSYLRIAYKTYVRSLLTLEKVGFLKILSKARNQHVATEIELCLGKYAEADAEAGTEAGTEARTPYINNKNSKTSKTIIAQITSYPFEAFWDAYGKKVDKAKSEKKWARLLESEREAAMKALPKYLAKTPNIEYRKNPLTYLNGEVWKDFEDQVKGGKNRVAEDSKMSPEMLAELKRREKHYERETDPVTGGTPGRKITFPLAMCSWFNEYGYPNTPKVKSNEFAESI